MNQAKKAILRTLAFFDQFQRGLTKQELSEWTWQFKIEDISGVLLALEHEGKIINQQGIYGLRNNIVSNAKLREIQALPLKEKGQLFANKLLRSPDVAGVFLVNSLALKTNHDHSDIDLLIIARPNRIWTVRLYAAYLAQRMGWRRHDDQIAGRICLSFFVTTEFLNMADIRLHQDDIYLHYWLLSAIYLGGEVDRSYLLNQNKWLLDNLPGIDLLSKEKPIIWQRKKIWRLVSGLTGIGWLIEKLIKLIIKPRTLKKAKALKSGSGVIVSDSIQKFHDHDRRAEFYEKWQKRCADLSL